MDGVAEREKRKGNRQILVVVVVVVIVGASNNGRCKTADLHPRVDVVGGGEYSSKRNGEIQSTVTEIMFFDWKKVNLPGIK